MALHRFQNKDGLGEEQSFATDARGAEVYHQYFGFMRLNPPDC
jgi:hypothetical protein